MRFDDFYEAYHFLTSHPANSLDRKVRGKNENGNMFDKCIYVEVVKVNQNHIEDGSCVSEVNEALNTKTEVWLEYGEVFYDEEDKELCFGHDPSLDCGGDTYEDAIIKMANNIFENPYYQEMFSENEKR